MEKQELVAKAQEMKAKVEMFNKIAFECRDDVKLVLKELGGEKVWNEDEYDECPCFTSYNFETPTDMIIRRVWLDENNKLVADCYAYEIDENYELELEYDNTDVFIELALFLASEIAE